MMAGDPPSAAGASIAIYSGVPLGVTNCPSKKRARFGRALMRTPRVSIYGVAMVFSTFDS